MSLAVLLEIRRRAEALSALGTWVGPLARVYPQVLPQVAGRLEGTGALGACKRPLARVSSLVLPEVRGGSEAAVAVWAREGPLARVGPPMLAEVALGVEALLAHLARKGPLVGRVADVVVLPQVAGIADYLLAHRAHLGPRLAPRGPFLSGRGDRLFGRGVEGVFVNYVRLCKGRTLGRTAATRLDHHNWRSLRTAYSTAARFPRASGRNLGRDHPAAARFNHDDRHFVASVPLTPVPAIFSRGHPPVCPWLHTRPAPVS